MNPSRILIHDYAGHPFQVQLSRTLAGRGHEVLHLYSASTHTPQGPLVPAPEDPTGLKIQPVTLPERVAKYSFIKRRSQERRYGRLLQRQVSAFRPDVVLSGNTPPDAQFYLQQAAFKEGARFVFWLQDVFGAGVTRVLRKRLPIVSEPISWHYRALERRMLKRSDAVVLISEDFRKAVPKHATDKAVCIENWAPLGDVPVLPKDNDWARAADLADTFNFVYAGTLGLKHDPSVLLRLAMEMRGEPNVRVVVISEGPGADWLRVERERQNLTNLRLVPFQPFELLPATLGAADVLVALLERDAGQYSVPSKVLTYLCAGRPILASMPLDNLGARTIETAEAGMVVRAGDKELFVKSARTLFEDRVLRGTLGANARSYAERMFNIEEIASAFERVLLLDGTAGG